MLRTMAIRVMARAEMAGKTLTYIRRYYTTILLDIRQTKIGFLNSRWWVVNFKL